MNINRDYLIINDVKKSNVALGNGSMFFYITDKNTQNIFVNLVINASKNELIQKYANIENAEDYTLTMNIVKPDNDRKIIEGRLHDKENAIFEFDLKEDCVDKIGTYKCELLTKCNINDHEEITTSNKLTYKVKSSVLNDLDDIVEAPEYPLVIQLFDKLSDIEQYEEDRRANELARQLAEEQRQTRFNTLDADMVDRVNAMDSKMDDVEARISAKEQAVDKLIVDTKVDIDDYKVAKDAEIDEYKATKDTEINNAITAQDNKIDEAITNQNNKIDTAIEEQNNRIGIVEASNNTQNTRLDALEAKDIAHETSITNIEAKNVEQDDRLDSIEAVNVSQDNRLDAIEIKNQQQDDRLLDVEKVNKRQDMDLKCLFAVSKNHMIDVTEEGNSIYLPNSAEGYCEIDNIQGNTLVNCNKEPNKELILNGNINTKGYSNVTLTEGVDGGLVDVALEGNTMVNVCDQKDSVALPFNRELTYLYANTQYAVQFVSDAVSKVDITLGGAKLLNQNVVVGTNKYMITTPSELINNNLVLNGEGFNASSIVVTEATDQDFGYFEGMKSVGECENNTLEIVCKNNDNSKSTTQTLTHEPLRAVGDTKDKYVLIDGKWYIERKCGVRAYQEGDIDNYITDMINTVYPLSSPTYEPINYNPFTVYSDVTHISNNSTIPCNMIIKNTGYNCLLKPSTTYTVSSNLGLNIITTPSTLTEDCLRFYDTDTSTVTTMKNVMVLEGDWTTKADLIPANFSGIESAFEQEYDAEKGKYKVTAKVANEDKSKENNITFYINEPLRGIGEVKDKVYVKNDKVVVERKCGSATFDGSDDEKWTKQGGDWDTDNRITFRISLPKSNLQWWTLENEISTPQNRMSKKASSDKFTYIYNIPNGSINEFMGQDGDISMKTPTRQLVIGLSKNKLTTQNVTGFKQWLQQNPTTVVYQLAEPTYEEVEYNDVKLFIESFKNSTLFYDSNIPVTSKVWYSYSIPLVDTVAQTANVTDQQDSMIIDLATQCAIMEMYLM